MGTYQFTERKEKIYEDRCKASPANGARGDTEKREEYVILLSNELVLENGCLFVLSVSI